ncbi:AAA family ATPase [Nocardia fluminea]|uniref:AAA family ATPase n=1 Tax=Nocardia fluminea TaxID=134984 RepID=UPI0033E90F89
MTAPPIARTAIFKDLDSDYGRRFGYVCVGYVHDRDLDNPKQKGTYHTPEQFFEWPRERSTAATYIKQQVEAGHCVYKPTSLCVGRSRTRTVPSDVLSFEVDDTDLSEEAWGLLDQVGATLVASGSPGHFHVKVKLDRDVEHDELWNLAKHLYSACGITEGGKCEPHGPLRIIGSLNTKYDPPAEVAAMRVGAGTTVEALRAVLGDYDAPLDVSRDEELIDAEEIAWDAVPRSIRQQVEYDTDDGDGSRRGARHYDFVGELIKEVQRRRLTKEQALYISVNYYAPIQTKWTPSERAADFHRCWDKHRAKKEPPVSSREKGRKPQVAAFGEGNSDHNTKRNTKTAWTFQELMTMRFAPLKYKVRNLIANGVVILTGSPKVGKSFWLLDLVVAVASGREVFGHFETKAAGVLYIYLEGGGARAIQSRIMSQQDEVDQGLDIQFYTEWPSQQDGGIEKLREYLDAHPDTGLVVIDTLAAFQNGGPTSSNNRWGVDYLLIKGLSDLAHAHDCAVVVAHHTKKGEETDFVDQISGTKGLSAAADVLITLDRERNSTEGKMKLTAREMEENWWNVEYKDLTWTVSGAEPLKSNADTLKEILEFVGTDHKKISDIIQHFDGRKASSAVRQCVHRARRARTPRLIQDEHGRYYRP